MTIEASRVSLVHCPMMNEEAELREMLVAFAQRVRDRRKEVGLTQEQLAEAADLSTNYIARIELGLKTPSLSTAMRLAKVMGVQVADLLADEHAKWQDEARELAHMLRNLNDTDAEFALKQFRVWADHLKNQRRMNDGLSRRRNR